MQNCSTKVFAAGIAVLLLAGCNRDSVKVYHVSDDQTQSQAQAQFQQVQTAPAMAANASDQPLPPGHPDIGGANMTMPAVGNSPLTWKTPAGWTEMPASELRVASFKVNQNGKSVDISVIPLGPMAGTDTANVNRWRGQVGLPQATDDDIQKSAESVEVAGQTAQLYDVVGTNPASGDKTRIIGVIQHRPDATWFYKMTGDGDLVEREKPAFVEFLKSLKFTDATAQTEMPNGGNSTSLPPGHPAIGGMGSMNPAAASSGPVSHEGWPNWTVPSDWKEIPPAQFLIAEFSIADGKADVNVASLAGTGGGVPANIARWRGQLGLAPLSEEDFSKLVETIDVAGGKGSLVDMTGTNMQTGQPTRLVGVIVPQADRTWFYKLMGDATVVAVQKDAFIKFVESAK